jgi:hypothetical protein
MYVSRQAVPVTTDAGGNATAYSEVVTGRIQQITYVPDGSNPLDTGADIVVTGEASAVAIVSKLNIGTSGFSIAPRQATHAVADGSALLYAAGGTAVGDKIAVAQERVKIVVAQGGNTKSGVFHVYVG